MRGPDLVGYPPTGLRWSADSQQLYFDWRKPGEDEASTYVVGRDGGAAPQADRRRGEEHPAAANGRWDKAHRRVLFVDGGDIVLVDHVAARRRQITRTTGAESSPRWARNDTHVTYVRDGNLFIVPVDGAGLGARDAADRRRAEEARAAADRQPEVPARRGREADRLRREAEGQKKKAEEKAKKDKLPAFELRIASRPRTDALARRHARLRRRRRARRPARRRRSSRTT